MVEALFVHLVALGKLDVRVGYNHQPPVRHVNNRSHQVHIILVESDRVEHKVLIFLGIPEVHPEDIEGEAVLFELIIVLDDLLRRGLFPARVVEAEGEELGEHGEASDCRQLLLHEFRLRGSQYEELHHATLGDEVDGASGLWLVRVLIDVHIGLCC